MAKTKYSAPKKSTHKTAQPAHAPGTNGDEPTDLFVDLSVRQIQRNGGTYTIDINAAEESFKPGAWVVYVDGGVFDANHPAETTIIPTRPSDRTLTVSLFATLQAHTGDKRIQIAGTVAGHIIRYRSQIIPNFIV